MLEERGFRKLAGCRAMPNLLAALREKVAKFARVRGFWQS